MEEDERGKEEVYEYMRWWCCGLMEYGVACHFHDFAMPEALMFGSSEEGRSEREEENMV